MADSYNNARVVKIAKDGTWLKTMGTYGSGQDQFNTVHSIAVDAQQGLVYVADRSDFRIQGCQPRGAGLEESDGSPGERDTKPEKQR